MVVVFQSYSLELELLPEQESLSQKVISYLRNVGKDE